MHSQVTRADWSVRTKYPVVAARVTGLYSTPWACLPSMGAAGSIPRLSSHHMHNGVPISGGKFNNEV